MPKNMNEIFKKHLVWLTIIFILTHWFLVVTTGQWWDDWVYADHNVGYMKDVWLQSSVPLRAYINMAVWNLPFRIIVFLMFYADTMLLYSILNKSCLFSSQESFYITALFVTVPINDARITFICFAYSFCLCLFFVSFYLMTLSMEVKGRKRVIFRIVSLLVLLISFDTESILIMTVLILGYVYFKESINAGLIWKWNNWKVIVRFLFRNMIRYIDFFLAPILWYVLDKTFFPGYGAYGGYNAIRWNELLRTLVCSPIYVLMALKSMMKNYFVLLKNPIVLVILGLTIGIFIIFICFFKRSTKKIQENRSFISSLVFLILGGIIFFIGAFPYVIRRANGIGTIGPDGRDSLLLGMGAGILLYWCVRVLIYEKFQKIVLYCIIILGMIHFNFSYAEWQESHYQQLQFRQEVKENAEIQDNNTFLVIFDNARICHYFWQTNGNAYKATGQQTRFFMSNVDDLKVLLDLSSDSYFTKAFMMRDYDTVDKTIEGVIFVDYTDISYLTILRQKWNELFSTSEFEKWIKDIKNIKYISITPEKSEELLNAYQNGKLSDGNIKQFLE